MSGTKFVYNTCPRDCYDTCSLVSKIENGRIVRVSGNKEHPITRGALCRKCINYENYIYDSSRVLYPYRRVGERGAGKFERITWENAVDLIATKINEIRHRFGSSAILTYAYAGNMGLLSRFVPFRLINLLGFSRIHWTVCDMAGAEALDMTYGSNQGLNPDLIPDMKLIVYWGINAKWTNVHGYTLAKLAKRKGAKIYVIDPVRTATAKNENHIAPVPGSDVLLALGIANYLIKNDLIDYEFIQKYVYGFDQFRNYIKDLDLRFVSSKTGVSTRVIEDFAHNYWEYRPNVIHMGYGLQRRKNGGDIVRAISFLPALVGLHRGFIYGNSYFPLDLNYLEARHLAPKDQKWYNMVPLGKILEQNDIRMLIIFNANPLATMPNQNLIRSQIIEKDIFVVVHDIYQTDSADFADILLPATTFFEHDDLNVSYYHRYISINQKAIEPIGEAKSNLEVMRLLARALNIQQPEIFEDEQTIIKEIIRRSGLDISLDELYKNGFLALSDRRLDFYPTPTGKIEFVQTSRPDIDALPKWSDFEYEHFQLLSPLHQKLLHSQYFTDDWIDYAMINPVDAKELNLNNGDRVKIFNDFGEIYRSVKISADMPRRCLLLYSSPWPKGIDGTNVNFLTSDYVEAYGGSSTYNTTIVKIEKL